jgi:hypothetical protein
MEDVSSAGGSCGKTKKSTIDRRPQPLVPNRKCYWRAKGAPYAAHVTCPCQATCQTASRAFRKELDEYMLYRRLRSVSALRTWRMSSVPSPDHDAYASHISS